MDLRLGTHWVYIHFPGKQYPFEMRTFLVNVEAGQLENPVQSRYKDYIDCICGVNHKIRIGKVKDILQRFSFPISSQIKSSFESWQPGKR